MACWPVPGLWQRAVQSHLARSNGPQAGQTGSTPADQMVSKLTVRSMHSVLTLHLSSSKPRAHASSKRQMPAVLCRWRSTPNAADSPSGTCQAKSGATGLFLLVRSNQTSRCNWQLNEIVCIYERQTLKAALRQHLGSARAVRDHQRVRGSSVPEPRQDHQWWQPQDMRDSARWHVCQGSEGTCPLGRRLLPPLLLQPHEARGFASPGS